VHHKSIIYNKPTRCNSGSIVFINDYRYALHVSIQPWNSTVRNRPWTSIHDLLHPNSWQTPVAAVTVYSAPCWWTQRVSKTCRAYLQLLINAILPELHLVGLLYIINFVVFVWKCLGECLVSCNRGLILCNLVSSVCNIHSYSFQLNIW